MSTTPIQTLDTVDVKDRITRFQKIQADIVTQVHRVIVGQEEVIAQVLVALFVGGHCLITGVPGTEKTLLVRTMAPILGLEFNRTPPKTQSALLEAMQELSCTVRGNQYKIRPPFFVLATQNPIELEGTYPLPEAQLDRFIFNVLLDYLSAEQEVKVLDLTTTTHQAQVNAVTTAEEILDFQIV